ncbi:MAG: uracil-DNA glycosylase [Gammaproteobacteria bacterium CG22_combo_CG10-13_8_21_14_all_40_8]|nr:MAG: uracil-DNA glycosylase [Gammaproteobacteria bacterium CG22_combo_CG10-13_8_21_14_all_40_8]
MLHNKAWQDLLDDQKSEPYFINILQYLKNCKDNNICFYPATKNIFNALKYQGPDLIKVVLIGQDPYHRENQAHGLSFSVPKGIPIPPSLANIYKEVESDLGYPPPTHGCLESWAEQGVLLLNIILTVEAGKPLSHKELGWERFTQHVISKISERSEHLVFLLWGKNAQSLEQLIDEKKHTILKAPHPSPLSSYRGFFGCKHFSKANKALIAHGQTPINWELTP